jgi:hypothetical protein
VAVICGEVTAVARELGIQGAELSDVGIAVSEAATNAVADGSSSRDDPRVGVRVDVADREMLVTISGGTEVCLTFSVAQLSDATNHLHDSAVRRLNDALLEQTRLSTSFDGAVGTSSEFGAYVRLQRAGEQVAARQTWLNWVDHESYRGINAGPFELAADRGPRPG